jgi:diguanylate cyclase (GGDEF)-like protein
VPLLGFMTIVALSAQTSQFADQTPYLASRMTAYLFALWAIAVALRLQKDRLLRAMNEVNQKMFLDPLTGLYNHRALRRQSSEWLEDSVRSDKANIALMMIDLDNFKEANTLHGHLGGDLTLRTVGEQIKRVLPKHALAARIGGDEFAVLAPVASAQQRDELAGLLRGAVRGAAAELDLPGFEFDASVGVAVAPRDGITLEQLLTVADESMYKEKAKHEQVPRSGAAPQQAAATAELAWQTREAGEVVEEVHKSGARAFVASRSELALFTFLGYAVGTFALAASLAMPGANHAHWALALGALLIGLLAATAILLVNCENRPPIHWAIDIFTIGSLLTIGWLTGGLVSPATPLIYLLVIHQAWFWKNRMLPWRMLTPSVVILAPLVYQGAGAEEHTAIAIATAFSAAATGLVLSISLYVNQLSTTMASRRAKRLAATDPLTGVPNRRAFNEFVEHELDARHENESDELAIVMIDLDNFKDVNTEQGHHAGDELIRAIARALNDAARRGDCVARVGGDEFAAVLPGAGIDGARALAERFVAAVEECAASSGDHTRAAVTASAGFALCPLHGSTLDELMRSADEALMQVKDSEKGTARVSRTISAL